MAEYIEREAALRANCYFCSEHLKDDSPCGEKCADYMKFMEIPAADVRPVVVCADCKYNNACLTQAFVEDESKMPFDRNAFFCADGKRADDV